MFIERYKLERNPFAPDSVRPQFVSRSMRQTSAGIRQVVDGTLQCLFVSGVAGVGKSTLAAQRMRNLDGVALSWIDADISSPEQLLRKMLEDIGPGVVQGSRTELRNILDVYLQHQRSQDRLSVIVADGLERFSADVMQELESLCLTRIKRLPVLQFILLTRNEDLANDMANSHEQSHFARAVHSKLTGFSLEETTTYIRACLQGSGSDSAGELIPDSAILNIQSCTQGVVGDVNTLCCAALAELAGQTATSRSRYVVSDDILRAAAARLHLRHDPEAWIIADENLTADAVKISDRRELKIQAARLIVSSEGQQLAEVALNRPRMVLGRDSGCDISLDSNYLSRYQNLFMETNDGWLLIDLNSTNGCFVNGRRVHEHRLRDGDMIAVGYHQLKFSAPRSRSVSVETEKPDATVAMNVSKQPANDTWGI